ncbi:hypothetical protein EVAR_16859_1 [Eumeta japonica]|uniref:Uncharacterized protein n=1 Tax=Eumeta variegata TaxID=151549 RepID=A0A4C1V2Z3_EUMVA|nr:hypothetical protein EVAR_16859_1 [Eumeta japonica]
MSSHHHEPSRPAAWRTSGSSLADVTLTRQLNGCSWAREKIHGSNNKIKRKTLTGRGKPGICPERQKMRGGKIDLFLSFNLAISHPPPNQLSYIDKISPRQRKIAQGKRDPYAALSRNRLMLMKVESRPLALVIEVEGRPSRNSEKIDHDQIWRNDTRRWRGVPYLSILWNQYSIIWIEIRSGEADSRLVDTWKGLLFLDHQTTRSGMVATVFKSFRLVAGRAKSKAPVSDNEPMSIEDKFSNIFYVERAEWCPKLVLDE